MPNKNYIKGARLERAIVNHLKAHGFSAVRSAGSKTNVDIVAWNQQYVYFIQAKNHTLSIDAKLRLLDGIAKRSGYKFTKPVVLTKEWKDEITMIE